MKQYEEAIYLCALNRIFGYKPTLGLTLINGIGNAEDIFTMADKDLEYLLSTYPNERLQIKPQILDLCERELRELKKKNIYFIPYNDPCYPTLLKECEDAPIGIYVRSLSPPEKIFNRKLNISVVGTRDLTPYGRDWCNKIIMSLATSDKKPSIVSGLALGIDAVAHSAALDAGLPTIAVMATGPEEVYPHRNRALAERIISTENCALISDYPPGTSPLALNFLRRNRIIAGISQNTILIESKIKGGGMMTANLAFSYDREVFALGGRIDIAQSQGCNYLIKNKIAEPIISLPELFKSLDISDGKDLSKVKITENVRKHYQSGSFRHDIDELSEILLTVRSKSGITIEEICTSCQMDYSRAAKLVKILETDGFIYVDLFQRCSINIKK